MRSRIIPVVALIAIGIALAGCGDDGDAGDDAPPKATHSSDQQTTGPTSEPSASVTAASGPVVENDALRLHLFENEEWIHVTDRSLVQGWVLDLDEGTVGLTLTVASSGSSSTELEADAKLAEEGFANEDPPVTRQENRTVNGVELWVFSGEDDKDRQYYLGTDQGGYMLELKFRFPSTAQWPESEERIEEILASVEWKIPTD